MIMESLMCNKKYFEPGLKIGVLIKAPIKLSTSNWIRVPTLTKRKKLNGSYIYDREENSLVIRNWETDQLLFANLEEHKSFTTVNLIDETTIPKFSPEFLESIRLHYRKAKQCESHAYLTKKCVEPHPILRKHGELLIVPLLDFNESKPRIHGLQRINLNGDKWFSKGTKTKGLCCSFNVSLWNGIKPLIIGEGVSTCLSLVQKTSYPAFAALNAANIINVAKIVRTRWPLAKMIIAADDDWLTEKTTGINPGLESAHKAAKIINAEVIPPPLSLQQKWHGLSDWNDYFTSLSRQK